MKVPYERSFAYLKPWAAKYWSGDNQTTPDNIYANGAKKIILDFVTPNGIMYSWTCEAKAAKLYPNGIFIPPAEREIRQMVVSGYNDLSTLYPSVSKQWCWDLNAGLSPSKILPKSVKKYWWVCDDNHRWEAAVCARIDGTGCPYCSGRLPVKGKTDLNSVHPSVAKQWHPTKNGTTSSADVAYGSGSKRWWLCNKGHEWEATVNSRTSGAGCPKCFRMVVLLPGLNDLESVRPDLAMQCHPSKNGDLDSRNIVVNSSDSKIWWLCSEGHEWESSIKNRLRGSGCPACAIRNYSSVPERYICDKLGMTSNISLSEYIGTSRFRTMDGHKTVIDKEFFLDYDGSYWHRDKFDVDTRKSRIILGSSENYYVIRVRENDLPHLNIQHHRLMQVSSIDNEWSLDNCSQKISQWVDRMANHQ